MAEFQVGGEWVFTEKMEVSSTPLPDAGGAVGSYAVIQQITTAPTTPVSAGYGMLYINASDELVYENSSGTTAITGGGGGSSWALTGNALVAAGTFGSTTNFAVSGVANSIEYFKMDPVVNAITLDPPMGTINICTTNAYAVNMGVGGLNPTVFTIFGANFNCYTDFIDLGGITSLTGSATTVTFTSNSGVATLQAVGGTAQVLGDAVTITASSQPMLIRNTGGQPFRIDSDSVTGLELNTLTTTITVIGNGVQDVFIKLPLPAPGAAQPLLIDSTGKLSI